MSLTIGGRVIGEWKIESMYGQPALGYYRLTTTLEFTLHPRPEESPIVFDSLRGELTLEGPASGRQHVGRMMPAGGYGPLRTHPHVNNPQFQLETELQASHVEAIEECRNGGDLRFKVNIWTQASHREGVDAVSDATVFQVNQSGWTKILEQWGYARIMLLEVPIPDESNAPQMARATSHVAAARTQMGLGHYREAVGCCRDAIEALIEHLGDSSESQPPADRRQWDKEMRLRELRRAMLQVCHPARHADEVASRFEWDRQDAVAAIALVVALLRWGNS